MTQYRWEHHQKQRYYRVLLIQDLFGDWVITKIWGGINQSSGRIVHLSCPSYETANIMIEQISKIREKRGYVLCVK
jgi:hypothetical protein